MINKVNIAVDAMGGDDSPKKIIKGIELFLKNNTDVSFKIFGNENLIAEHTGKIDKNLIEIIHTDEKIDNEIEYLHIAIDKTASEHELEAWGWLMNRIRTFREQNASKEQGSSV